MIFRLGHQFALPRHLQWRASIWMGFWSTCVVRTKGETPLVRNRLFSSFQILNSSLHCFSYPDALHERQRAWRGTEMSKHFKEDLPWLGSSCSLLACAKSPGRSASNTQKDSRACYPRSAHSPPWSPVLDASA